MNLHRRTIRSIPVFLLGLCLAPPGGPAGAAQNPEAVVSASSTGAALRLSDGRVFGDIEERPLAEVLDFFAAATGLDYEVPDDLRGHPVSIRLEGLRLNETLEEVLRPFDYIASFTAEGSISGLLVRGLRASYAGPAVTKNRARLAPIEDRARQTESDIFEPPPIPVEPIYAEDWLEDLRTGGANPFEVLERAKHVDP